MQYTVKPLREMPSGHFDSSSLIWGGGGGEGVGIYRRFHCTWLEMIRSSVGFIGKVVAVTMREFSEFILKYQDHFPLVIIFSILLTCL